MKQLQSILWIAGATDAQYRVILFRAIFRTTLLCTIWSICMHTPHCSLLAQELYPNTEAASNSPKDVLRVRAMTMLMPVMGDMIYTAKAFYSVSDKLMLASTINASSWLAEGFPLPFRVYDPLFRSVNVYAKYRVFSDDAPHRHVRCAAFAEIDYAPNSVSLSSYLAGIKNGASLGGIGTVLLHRTALSATASYFLPLTLADTKGLEAGIVNYSLSVGHLALPERYAAYSDINLNLYCEFLGNLYAPPAATHPHLDKPTINDRHYYNRIDIAPSVQLIINSQAKIDISVRTQLLDEYYTTRHWMVMLAFEWYFF